jgi:diaminopimelate decarboxylase
MLNGSFGYRNGTLCCEDVNLESAAQTFGTPAYVYSTRAILDGFRAYQQALAAAPHRICYSVKANSNLSVLRLLAQNGAGFDIVSGGELYRLLQAGANPETVVFSGVGKTRDEIAFALKKRIHSFNCESEAELELISETAAALRTTASIAIRVNPDVDAVTHPYISTGLREHKFGIDVCRAEQVYKRAAGLPGIAVTGISCHIGSQLLDTGPLLEAADKVVSFAKRLRAVGFAIRELDFGGGVGVPYRTGERYASVPAFVGTLVQRIAGSDFTVMLEPGRSIVAEAGVLLVRVLLVKSNAGKTFVVVDGGMNDLIRPALYQAHHEIVPVSEPKPGPLRQVDVVGPVCESGDFFAHNRQMAQVEAGDLLAIATAGAYGFVLSSNYNSRPRACELLIDGAQITVARQRETYADLVRGET